MLDSVAFNAAIANRSLVLLYDSRTQRPNSLALLESLIVHNSDSDRTDTLVGSISADGPVFNLPAGSIRFALGIERRGEDIHTWRTNPENPLINLRLFGDFSRDLDSVYAETRIPIVGPKQQWKFLNRLDLTTAVRYDRYSDVGKDYNPRYGVQLRPVSWLLLRATRNSAFRAPTINDLYRPATNSTTTITGFPTNFFTDPVTGQLINSGVMT